MSNITHFYYYEHCPFCNRVAAILNLADLNIKKQILQYSDAKTPTKMIGSHMSPILGFDDGTFQAESLDLVNLIAKQEGLDLGELDESLFKIFDEVNARLLVYPRAVTTDFPEFSNKEDRDFFIKKIAPVTAEEAIADTHKYLPEFETWLNKLNETYKDKFISKTFGSLFNDIYMFSTLRLYTLIKTDFPKELNSYLKYWSSKFKLELFFEVAK